MSNVLSQNEIDELLSALASGQDAGIGSELEDDKKEAKVYDF